MVTAYLTEEQALGRVAATADIPTLSHMLIGSVHLLFTDRESGPPDAAELYRVVATVLDSAIVNNRRPPRRSVRREHPSE
jgi:hypothetical protein